MRKLILCILTGFLLLNCKKENSVNSEINIQKNDTTIENTSDNNSISSEEKTANNSFTLDCGSGCAMTYNEISRNKNKNLIEIKYKISQYINEEPQDDYFETYIFETDDNDFLKSIHLNTDKQNILSDDSSLIKEKLLEVSKEFSKGLSNDNDSKNIELVTEKKPYNLIPVPFDLKEYIKNLPNEIKNNYTPSNKLINYLSSIDYEGENYKCYFLKTNNTSSELIVSITRGESEYFVLIKVKDNKFLSYKEIGSIGGESTKYFKIDNNYNLTTL